MLTKKQYEVLRIIRDYQNKYRNFPNMTELSKAFKHASNSGIYPVIDELVDEGYLDRLHNGSYIIANANWMNEPIKPYPEDERIEAAIKYYKENHGI